MGDGENDGELGYPAGWRIIYITSPRRGEGLPPIRTGTVTGSCLHDVHTNTTWVPVRATEDGPDIPSQLVRSADVIDAYPPSKAP